MYDDEGDAIETKAEDSSDIEDALDKWVHSRSGFFIRQLTRDVGLMARRKMIQMLWYLFEPFWLLLSYQRMSK